MAVKIPDIKGKFNSRSPLVCLAANLLLALIVFMACRVIYLLENWGTFGEGFDAGSALRIFLGGLIYDISAVCYLNALYILLMLIPVHLKEKSGYYRVVKWFYVVPNAIAVVLNLGDAVLYHYRLHRATSLIYSEFRNDTSTVAAVLGDEFLAHWYLVLAAAALIAVLIICYRRVEPSAPMRPLWKYYLAATAVLAFVGYWTATGMRGALFTHATRPISLNEAHLYVRTPQQVDLVLNTPYSLIRTIGGNTRNVTVYFDDPAELLAIVNPIHEPHKDAVRREKNVVVIIVESLSTEFVGSLNTGLEGGRYKGYTPFVDSLLTRSMTFERTFSNTGYSIDAMPAILASIPRMDRSYVVSPYSLNRINSIASELKTVGYSTAFFHGACNESMGLGAFARQAGFDRYYGKDEYVADTRRGGENDFDGRWAIWDEEFLQFFCDHIGELKPPFVAGVFTASSHHPYNVPERYRDRFPEEGTQPVVKTIRYVDNALRLFFESAAKQPWYENTIFIVTADHACPLTEHPEYHTEIGHFKVPILFFEPKGELPVGVQPGTMQQIDIMPTLLDYLGYDKPFFTLGKSMADVAPEDTWAFHWDHFPEYMTGDYLMTHDGHNPTGLYNYVTDPLLTTNLLGTRSELETRMDRHIKGIIQTYLTHGLENTMTADR